MPHASSTDSLDRKDPARIAAMFDAIAPRYDLLNHLLSAGLDRHWRRRAIEALQLTGRETLLDLCTGTGDLAIAGVTHRRTRARRAIGVDFSFQMLSSGRRKLGQAGLDRLVRFVRADATRIPLPAASVDAAAIGFGIRNVEDPPLACAEIFRVLRRGGRLAILEFGIPRARGLRSVYLWYFRRVLPRVGRAISRHDHAYSYLPASVGAFPSPDSFSATLQDVGFTKIRAIPLTLGVVYLYLGVKD